MTSLNTLAPPSNTHANTHANIRTHECTHDHHITSYDIHARTQHARTGLGCYDGDLHGQAWQLRVSDSLECGREFGRLDGAADESCQNHYRVRLCVRVHVRVRVRLILFGFVRTHVYVCSVNVLLAFDPTRRTRAPHTDFAHRTRTHAHTTHRVQLP